METKINMNNALIMKKSKIFCDNGNCNGGRAFRVANSVKWFCGPCCLNKGLNLKPTDEDYWTVAIPMEHTHGHLCVIYKEII